MVFIFSVVGIISFSRDCDRSRDLLLVGLVLSISDILMISYG